MNYISAVRDDTVVRLRAAVQEVAQGYASGRAMLLATIGEEAALARRAGVTVERLIVEMKAAWDGAIAVHGGSSDMAVQRLKQDVITHVIEAYYVQ